MTIENERHYTIDDGVTAQRRSLFKLNIKINELTYAYNNK